MFGVVQNILILSSRKLVVDTAHNATEIWASAQLSLYTMILKSKNNITVFAIYVWCIQGCDRCPQRADCNTDLAIGQSNGFDFFSSKR